MMKIKLKSKNFEKLQRLRPSAHRKLMMTFESEAVAAGYFGRANDTDARQRTACPELKVLHHTRGKRHPSKSFA